MAAFDRFLIAPIQGGLETDLRPWLIMDDSFPVLSNVYCFRGRIRKRFGGSLTGNGAPDAQLAPYFSRLSINIGMTDGSGNFTDSVPGLIYTFGQAFVIGEEIFTVPSLGNPVDMLTTGSSTVHTYSTSTGVVTITGATANTNVYFYPALPVMGLTTYDETGVSINDQPAYAFDTQFAYVFADGFWQRSGDAQWHGGNSNFFWCCNWRGTEPQERTLFVSNYYVVNPNGSISSNDDFIWYTEDGSTWTEASGPTNGWFYFPDGGAPRTGAYIKTAKIIVNWQDRLLLFNTIEVPDPSGTDVNVQFVNRVRWSHQGSPLDNNSWYVPGQQDNSGSPTQFADGGGVSDAYTEEAIISAEFIKNRLIIYFERSTWELVFTNNQSNPFIWQKINTELGSEGTFSTVPFDRHVLTMGNVGVHACNGSNVERIDKKIPDEIFEISNKNEGVERVVGIRDYFTEMVYWTFPSDVQSTSQTYPNRVLVYNYRNGSWALNDDCITMFGYFNQQVDLTWSNATMTWNEAEFTWDSATGQSQFRQVIAGNQQGFIFIVDPELGRNAPVMQISAMTSNANDTITMTVVDHTLSVGEWVAIENAQFSVSNPIVDLFNWQVINVIDSNTITISGISFTGTYQGGATLTRVSNIDIVSKQFNPYVDQDRNVQIQKIDFGLKRAAGFAQIMVDFYTSSSSLPLARAGLESGAIVGDSMLTFSAYPNIPYESTQDRVWHTIYFQAQGQNVQIEIYFSPAQMPFRSNTWADFELEGMILYTRPVSYRLHA